MKLTTSTLCVGIAAVAISACQDDSKIDNGKSSPELINVSDHLQGTQRYDIDLSREDAIYFLAPNPDVGRLSVTCPSLASMSFAEYIAVRIRPTGVKYDPTINSLRLANAMVPREAMPPVVGQAALCPYSCWDEPSWETCYEECDSDPTPEP